MQVLLPVHHFPPTYSAGAELYTLRLGKALQSLSHEVEVVSIEAIDQGDPSKVVAECDTYDGIKVWRLRMNLIKAPERPIWEFDNPLLETWFHNHLRTSRPDIVHFQSGYLLGLGPMRAAHTLDIPSVLTLHDYWMLCPRYTLLRSDGRLCSHVPDDPKECASCYDIKTDRKRKVDRLTLGVYSLISKAALLGRETEAQEMRRSAIAEAIHYPGAIVALSRFMATRMQEVFGELPIHHIPCAIDQLPDDLQRGTASADNVFRVGYLGQVVEHKGVHLLIQAWRGLRGSRPRQLHIYGGANNPAYLQRLERLAAGDQSIVFHGRYAPAERGAILRSLDVTVVPSIWYENRPVTIAESLSAGVPSIVARLGGMAEMLKEGIDGLCFAPDDAADLTRKLQQCLDDHTLLARLKSGTAHYSAPSSIDEAEQLLALYTSVIAAKEKASI